MLLIRHFALFFFHQNICNNHDTSEEGHGVIEKALDSMMNVATHINEMKRQHEHALRLQEIQCHLCDWDGTDLMTLGNLILEVGYKFRIMDHKLLELPLSENVLKICIWGYILIAI